MATDETFTANLRKALDRVAGLGFGVDPETDQVIYDAARETLTLHEQFEHLEGAAPSVTSSTNCRYCQKPIYEVYNRWMHSPNGEWGTRGCSAYSYDGTTWDETLDKAWVATPPRRIR